LCVVGCAKRGEKGRDKEREGVSESGEGRKGGEGRREREGRFVHACMRGSLGGSKEGMTHQLLYVGKERRMLLVRWSSMIHLSPVGEESHRRRRRRTHQALLLTVSKQPRLPAQLPSSLLLLLSRGEIVAMESVVAALLLLRTGRNVSSSSSSSELDSSTEDSDFASVVSGDGRFLDG